MRYIDADRFEVVTSQRHSEDFIDGMDYILDMIDKAPTKDVVPRAEVEKARQEGFKLGKTDNIYGHSVEQMAKKVEELSVELEAMRGAANSYKMHYENGKQEVAREIFAELENIIIDHHTTPFGLEALVIGDAQFNNLKKKYIGE